MKNLYKAAVFAVLFSACSFQTKAQENQSFFRVEENVPESAKPWVFWYWMHASFSKEGITADLQAMKEAGIGGAYLAPIKGKTDPPLYEPVIETLTPEWWDLIRFTLNEADRLGIKIALLPNDGFATAGGPWITPELSMQKVVWSSAYADGGKMFNDTLPRPESYQGYYKDIAVYAYPTPWGAAVDNHNEQPRVTVSKEGIDAQFLAEPGNKKNFTSDEPCWIQFEYERPFTCRSITIHVNNYNYQSQRLLVEVSDDGKNFRKLTRLEPPRAGWLDWDAPVTHGIAPVTAKYFRFIYDKEGSEPGAEDLDAAKWKQSLKIAGIELSSTPKIHQFEGKTGEVWRVSRRTTSEQLPDSLCVPLDKMIDISRFMDASGRLRWKAPASKQGWTILRVGHTSTGHKNETAGNGKGLEVDKFNADAVKMQFDKWFGEAVRTAGPELASRVLKIFHVDSWECGSQNWTLKFVEEFEKRRGYNPIPFLPAMAGVPVQSADVSERFLYDVRHTISELMSDKFFKTLHQLAHENGAEFTSETTAPVMAADGLIHFKDVDVPMGEFWLRSPSHDKPNDMLDAVSGAHIYGKPIVQAEAFTQIRMEWDEHPGMLKALQDRNYALGINRFVYHVYVLNPWMDRKPGMTLDGVGLYFQRDQTWWEPGKAWVKYAQRTQSMLQQGRFAADIAVFTGEEFPRRSLLPDRLVSSLPGIFGKDVVEKEKKRLANEGSPLQRIAGVTTSANIADPADWVNSLRGYAYDSFNPDALLNLAKVNNGKVVFPGGASYALLVLPGKHQMNPNNEYMTVETASRLLELVKSGASLLINERPRKTPGLKNAVENDKKLRELTAQLWEGDFQQYQDEAGVFLFKKLGNGRVIKGPFEAESFAGLGLERDVIVLDEDGKYASHLAWTHRINDGSDVYFIANQLPEKRVLELSLRTEGKQPQLYNAVTGEIRNAAEWKFVNGRTVLPLMLEPNASVFVILNKPVSENLSDKGKNWLELKPVQTIDGSWSVSFDPDLGGPENPVVFNELSDWSRHTDSLIRYYSGTAVYSKVFKLKKKKRKNERIFLDLGQIADIAQVEVNGISCGTVWTAPYRADITRAVKKGKNQLQIKITNTWANRMIGDQKLPEDKQITRTTAPFRLQGKPLNEAGLLGPVKVMSE